MKKIFGVWLVCAGLAAAAWAGSMTVDGGTIGNLNVTGGMTAGTLALTNGPIAAGAVWVATNANGSGELRVLAKCQIFPQGSIPTNSYYTNAVWTTNGMFNIGDMTANARGIQVNHAGTYMASYVYNIEGITSAATRVRGRIVIDGAGINYGPLVLSAGSYASVSETAIASCASGSVISVMYYVYSSDEGLTNRATHGGHFSVIELP